MQTIAQQLKITKFPFEIKDDNGNLIYLENSDGKVIDERPKCENKMVEVTMAQQTFEFERDIQGKNQHSVYTHCLNCHSWGINGPFGTECGNCLSNDTLTYYDSKTINDYLITKKK